MAMRKHTETSWRD